MQQTQPNVRLPAEILRDRALVADLYLKGWTQTAIAEKLHRTQPSVSDDLAAIRKEWKKSRIRDFDEARAVELEKIDKLEREAWEAWERSMKPRETSTSEHAEGLNARNRVQFRKQEQNGNPAYFATIQWCIDRRCKLLGLDAPERLDAHVTTGVDERGTIDERMAKYAHLFAGRAIVVDGTAHAVEQSGVGGEPGRRLEADSLALPAGDLRPAADDNH